MPRKISPNNIRAGSRHIPPALSPRDELLRFSFKHLDLFSNPKFCLDHCAEGYLDKFLGRLKDLSQMTVCELRANKTKALRAHTITWNETSEPNGFTCLNEQLREEEAWQFEITANVHGRVHGFLLGGTFHMVWIDPDHRLYS